MFDFGCICYDYLLFGDRVLAFDELLVEAEEDIDEVVVPDVDGVEELFENGWGFVVDHVEDEET